MRKLISLDLPFPCHSVLRGSPNYPAQGLMISTPQCSKSLTFLVTIFAPLETAIAAICAVYHITGSPSCSLSFPMHNLSRPEKLSGVLFYRIPLCFYQLNPFLDMVNLNISPCRNDILIM